MLWFEPFPWARWALAWLITLSAIAWELRPEHRMDALFAAEPIQRGDVLDASNTETRAIPRGLFETAHLGDTARTAVPQGDPVLASDVSVSSDIPSDWWTVATPLPAGAHAGDPVRVVLLDTGEQVEGFAATLGSQDPFGAAEGSIAVPPEWSSQVAVAAAAGRIAVLVSTG